MRQARAARRAEIDRVDVVRRSVRAHEQREPRLVAREAHLREIARRQIRQRDFLAAGVVEDVHDCARVFVDAPDAIAAGLGVSNRNEMSQSALISGVRAPVARSYVQAWLNSPNSSVAYTSCLLSRVNEYTSCVTLPSCLVISCGACFFTDEVDEIDVGVGAGARLDEREIAIVGRQSPRAATLRRS